VTAALQRIRSALIRFAAYAAQLCRSVPTDQSAHAGPAFFRARGGDPVITPAMREVTVDTRNGSGGRLPRLSTRLHAASCKVLMRCTYATRLLYWTARHRSIDTARWVVAFEGHTW
jgi:hypothetical protein